MSIAGASIFDASRVIGFTKLSTSLSVIEHDLMIVLDRQI